MNFWRKIDDVFLKGNLIKYFSRKIFHVLLKEIRWYTEGKSNHVFLKENCSCTSKGKWMIYWREFESCILERLSCVMFWKTNYTPQRGFLDAPPLELFLTCFDIFIFPNDLRNFVLIRFSIIVEFMYSQMSYIICLRFYLVIRDF